ncbi:Fic family protein [Agromyces silvae]|uniref:Fic family protein n=1 Tax=Agromyces silvae TaxID=3388266 RepID=UPI00280AF494|nr:Fic family protein [Agromyces protaetiae]
MIIELERARTVLGKGTTPPVVYRQLKALSQLLTSIMSARIEGNRTSILDAVSGVAKTRGPGEFDVDEGVEEILNIQRAVDFVDAAAPSEPISNLFIRELHRLTVEGLRREGDRTPGAYRLGEVRIGQSKHQPPWPADVTDHMNRLIDFVAEPVEPQKQLLQTAIAHHRFLWIHPFGNGNGRVARLLTYAMLVKQGFSSPTDYRAINPTAVFGADRAEYYNQLEHADSLSNDAIISWCTYLLEGLASDVEKLTRLGDADFVTEQLLLPAVERMQRSGGVTVVEARILGTAARKTTITAADLTEVVPGVSAKRSQAIRRLLDRHLLERDPANSRKYHLVFSPNDFTIHLVHRLDRVGLLPRILRDALS